jgi:hypothetical protein
MFSDLMAMAPCEKTVCGRLIAHDESPVFGVNRLLRVEQCLELPVLLTFGKVEPVGDDRDCV